MNTTTISAGRSPLSVEAEQTYKVPEVAAYLRVDKAAVYEMIRDGALRHVRIGRLIRVPQSALDEFLAGHGSTAAK